MTSIHSNRPSKGTETGRVWEIADEFTRRSGGRARRADVIRAFVEEGGNPNTAATQYQAWKSDYDERQGADAVRMREQFFDLPLREGGRVLIPQDLRERLGVKEGDILVGEFVDGQLTLMSRDTAVRKAQDLVRRYVPEGVSLVDELIAERRAEAARENEG
jgi:bifunctional DNA-binding transcriptional regulator/antitoxin component of YhaV-PrlF toxin-antitoxin module